MRKILPIFFFTFIVLVFFWQVFFKGLLPIPSDSIIGLYHPWRDLYSQNYPNGIPVKNFLITDPVRQQYPWKYLSFSLFKQGELPLWNPYSFSGYPLLGNLQSASFYPLNFLLFLLPFNFGWSVLIILQPLLAGLFLYLFLRQFNLKKEACILGSLSYAFSGFFIAWLEWNTVLHVALWLPLILLIKEKIIFQFLKPKSLMKIILLLIILVLAESSYWLAGHFQIAFYLWIFSVIYLIVRVWQRAQNLDLKQIILFFGLAEILVFLIAFVQGSTFFLFLFHSGRSIDQSNWLKEGWFIPWPQLIQFVAPDFFGNPATLNYWGVWNYAEMIGYVGIVPLIFALYALFFRRDKKTFFFGTFFFLSLILATPTFLAELPYKLHLPLLSSSQPTRLLFITDFCLAVLAALGLDQFVKKKTAFSGMIKIMAGLAIVFGVLWIFVSAGRSWLPTTWIDNLYLIKRNLLLPSLLLLMTMVCILFYFFSARKYKNVHPGTFFLYILILITIFDLFRFGWKFTPFTKKEYLFPETKITQFLQAEQKKDLFRIMSADSRIFPPNFSDYYQIQSVDGYDPLFLQDYGELVSAWQRNKPDISPLNFNRIITVQNFESRIADLLNVKYVLSLNNLESPKLVKVFEEGQTKVYENKRVFPRAFLVENLYRVETKEQAIAALFNNNLDLQKTAVVFEAFNIDQSKIDRLNETVAIVQYSANKIQIRTKTRKKRFMVLTDIYYPTWKVFIDGRQTRIYKTDFVLRGVIVPEGEHLLEFKISIL